MPQSRGKPHKRHMAIGKSSRPTRTRKRTSLFDHLVQAWYVCPERVAELGAPLSRRVGPLLFHIGSPLQYSHSVTSIMGVVHRAVRGTRLRDWRLRHLPGGDGSLLAVQGSGFFLVRSSAIRRCVPAREADVFLTWQARGNWERVELRLIRPTLRTESNRRNELRRRFMLCLYRRSAPYCKVLRLRSRRAALCAFSFVQATRQHFGASSFQAIYTLHDTHTHASRALACTSSNRPISQGSGS